MYLAYCDGGKRKDRGAYAYVILKAPIESVLTDYNGKVTSHVLAYGYGDVPNIRSSAESEIIAAREALMRLRDDYPKSFFTVVSDSTYVVHGLKAPFRMAQNNERYRSIWMDILPLCVFTQFDTMHVKGHSRQTFNTLCDWICNDWLDHDGRNVERGLQLFASSRKWRKSLINSRK